MYEKILVPLDGSDLAEGALPYALEVAAASRSEVILTTISESSDELSPLYQAYIDRMIARTRGEMLKRSSTEQRVRGKALIGKPADEILRLVEEEQVSLIVLANRGTGQGPWALGHIASKVLQASRTPVMLVKTGKAGRYRESTLVKRILLPLDTSIPGAAATPYAAELARLLHASLVLLHVEPKPLPWLLAPGVEFAYLPPVSPDQQAKQLTSHMEYVYKMAQALREKGLVVSCEASAGSPASEILSYAAANEIDLIALSTHGHSGLARFVYGSVTEKVLEVAELPVLVVRPVLA